MQTISLLEMFSHFVQSKKQVEGLDVGGGHRVSPPSASPALPSACQRPPEVKPSRQAEGAESLQAQWGFEELALAEERL